MVESAAKNTSFAKSIQIGKQTYLEVSWQNTADWLELDQFPQNSELRVSDQQDRNLTEIRYRQAFGKGDLTALQLVFDVGEAEPKISPLFKQQYFADTHKNVLLDAMTQLNMVKGGKAEAEARSQATKKLKTLIGQNDRSFFVELLNNDVQGKQKIIKVDPSRKIRKVSIRHTEGKVKGLRLMDDENEYIVDSNWYEKSQIFDDEGEWSQPIEIPEGSYIWGLKTNASSALHSLSFSFIVRESRTNNLLLQTNMSNSYFSEKPQFGWLSLELQEARDPEEMFPHKIKLTLLSSTRIDQVTKLLGQYVGRVEDLKFYDKNPNINAEYLLRSLLTEHYKKQKARDPKDSAQKHLERAYKEEAYMSYTIDLLAKGEDNDKKPTEEQRQAITKSLEVTVRTIEANSTVKLQELFESYGVQGLKRNLLKNTEEAKSAHKVLFYSFKEYSNEGEAVRVFMKHRYPLKGKENPMSINYF